MQNDGGNTALILAASYDRTEIVELLLAYKADLNIKNNAGYTALSWASSHACHEAIKILSAYSLDDK